MNKNRAESKTEQELQGLEQRVAELVALCERLKEENRLLHMQQESLTAERAGLIDKNELSRTRVEAMVNRLKAMEQLN